MSNPDPQQAPQPEPDEPQPAAPTPSPPTPPAATATKVIRCPNCYHRFRSDKKFCPKCGRSRAELAAYIEEKREIAADQRAASQTWLGVRSMVGLYAMLMGFNFLAAYVLPTDKPWGLLGVDLVIVTVCIVWLLSSRGALRAWSGPGFNVFYLMAIPLGGVLTYAITVFDNNIAVTLLGLRDLIGRTQGIDRFVESPIPLGVQIVSIALIPGIFEEIFFRGMVQGTLETALSKRDAWIVQAIVFAIAHINPIGFFTYLLLLGLYFGWLRNRSNSIIPGMIAHFSHNLLCVLAGHYHWKFVG